MKNPFLKNPEIAYIEIYTPMAKVLAYWHQKALGFDLIAQKEDTTSKTASYVLKSNAVNLVLTSAYPTVGGHLKNDIIPYVQKNYCGVKRIAIKTENVKETFACMLQNGAIKVQGPTVTEDEGGSFEEASIQLYTDNEIVITDSKNYTGVFKPGYVKAQVSTQNEAHFEAFDHVAAELKVNEINFWTDYVSNTIGTNVVQKIERSEGNTTGMLLNISQSDNKALTLVMAEPDYKKENTKIQKNIEEFGAGIHHLAFSTNDMVKTLESLQENGVEFVKFPPSYYDILRENEDMKGMDIDLLEKHGILVDKQGDAYLLQKFIKPLTERPFFFYEIVQRVNGYNAFALANINVLKRAEELQIMKSEKVAG